MSLLGKALGPRNAAATQPGSPPVPYVARGATGGSGFGGGGSVGPMGQMSKVGSLFAVVDRICTAAIAPDWELYRKPKRRAQGGDDQRQIIEPAAHAAALVWAQPNPFMTRSELMEIVQQHVEVSPTGDGFLLVVRAGSLPVELWPVRPDRMIPVPDQQRYLAGWAYRSPDGELIPLGNDEVLQLKGTPNPEDLYRGMGRVQSLIRDLEGSAAAAEYAAAFFANSAQPGGLIEIEQALGDDEFETLRRHWQEQHRGVRNAHRVAILEHGKWRDRAFSMKDLEFTALRNLSRDQIYEAFGVSRATMGLTDGVNFAAAKAARLQFAELLTEPRLVKWRELLNHRLLPLFYAPGATIDVEFDFESPVPTDVEEANAERDSTVQAVATLVSAGWNPQAAAEAYGLPDIAFGDGTVSDPDRDLMIKLVTSAPAALAPMLLPVLLPNIEFPDPATGQAPVEPQAPDEGQDEGADEGAPPPSPAEGEGDEAEPEQDATDNAHRQAMRLLDSQAIRHAIERHLRNAGDDQADDDRIPDVDLSSLDAQWRQALDRLLARWDDITAEQRQQLRALIKDAIDRDDIAALARLELDATEATGVVHEAMLAMALIGATSAVDEAAEVGVELATVAIGGLGLDITAEVVAVLLADDLANAGGREALRVHTPEKSGDQVASEVDAVMRERSKAPAEAQLGGALTGATNAGRVQTFASGPIGSLYADESLDGNTCKFCREINGRFVCNTDDLAIYNRLYTSLGGYVNCAGGVRCRGTVVGVWRPQTVDNPEESP